jgi:hypothetical protein
MKLQRGWEMKQLDFFLERVRGRSFEQGCRALHNCFRGLVDE